MDKINGARVRDMAQWPNMSYSTIAKDQHVDHKLIQLFMDVNKITLDNQSYQSRAAQKKKSLVSDKLKLKEVRELANKPGSTLKLMAGELGVSYTTIQSFAVRHHISVNNRMPMPKSQTRLLEVDDIRKKAGAEGASFHGIAKSSNVSTHSIIRFMRKHEIGLLNPSMRSDSKRRSKDTSARISIASLVTSD